MNKPIIRKINIDKSTFEKIISNNRYIKTKTKIKDWKENYKRYIS